MNLIKKKLDYKWVILACAFTMVFVCLGFCSSNKGLYLTAITDALGLKRSLFSINDSCRFIATAVMNLFFGKLLYRYGIRKVVAFGFVALIASTLVYAFAESIFAFYVGGTLLGVGLSFTATTIGGSLVRRWFKTNVGRYTGIVFAANGVGGALAAQIISPMINEPGNPFGYRKSYLLVAAILLVVGITVVVLLRERPKNEEFVADPSAKKKPRGLTWAGTDYDVVKYRPYFWLAGLCVLVTGFILQGIGGVYAAHLKDSGFDASYIATVASVYALVLTASKVFVGFMYDKLGLRFVMILCQLSTVAAFVIMAILEASPVGMVMAMMFAILYAIALPLETLVIPLIVNDLFGSASYDKILGIVAAMNYAGYALGAPATNLCYDMFGSYRPMFWIFAAVMIPICIVFQFIITASHKAPERSKN